jgi:hypothetical protein
MKYTRNRNPGNLGYRLIVNEADFPKQTQQADFIQSSLLAILKAFVAEKSAEEEKRYNGDWTE